MMHSMIRGAIPFLLAQFENVTVEDKRRLAAFLNGLCAAYLMADKPLFDYLLQKGGFPVEWTLPLSKALWGNDENTGK